MSVLPKIPYTMRKNKSQVVAMRGINYSNVTQDGDIADSKGISARSYPYITTRKAREKQGQYSNVTAMTVFNNKIVVVADGKLYWGGQEIGELTPGEKQFAPINSKLCIMPDKKYFDSRTMTLEDMGAEVRGCGAIFTENSLTLNNTAIELARGRGGNLKGNCFTVELPEELIANSVNVSGDALWLERYRTGTVTSSAIAEKYIEFDGGLHTLGEPSELYINGTRYYGGGWGSSGGKSWYIPSSELPYSEGTSVTLELIVPVNNLEAGDIITVRGKTVTVAYVSARTYVSANVTSKPTTGSVVRNNWLSSFDTSLKIGQKILIRCGDDIVVSSTVTDITPWSITFEDSGIRDIDSENDNFVIFAYAGEEDGSLTDFAERLSVGDVVHISGCVNNSFNNRDVQISAIYQNILYVRSDTFEASEEIGVVEIERKIPDFDYICSSENRIWGCSNKDNTIYASALGDPTNFFVNTGISTDSYAVAVGSEGRFTACCRFASSVLFWKETKLHKILGSYPSEYTMYSYDFEGVQEGSHKSLQIINEALYYKGIHGIYAFDSSPTLISSNFGDKYFTDAVAGVDGDSYYISMRGEDERDYLFVYETLPGLWVLEDDVKVFDFARIGKDMYMLTESGEFYLCGAKDTDTDMEWLVQLTPFYETVEGHKTYSRLLLRVELPQGSFLRVEVRADGRAWREAGKIVGKRQDVVPVLIPVNRCDKFEIRLSGKGKCTVMSILREFYIGGER